MKVCRLPPDVDEDAAAVAVAAAAALAVAVAAAAVLAVAAAAASVLAVAVAAAAVLAVAVAAAAVLAVAVAAEPTEVTVTVTVAANSIVSCRYPMRTWTGLPASQGADEEADEDVLLEPDAAETPATAALISSAVASGTSRFWEKMHPWASFASSQVLPGIAPFSTCYTKRARQTHPCQWCRPHCPEQRYQT